MSYSLTENRIPGRKITLKGAAYLWLGGTNYLNIGSHPTFQQALAEGIKQYSQNFGSSRRNNVQFSIWDEFERALAAYFHVEAAALCSSGLAAAQIALQYTQQKSLPLNLAPQAHPALWRHPYKPFAGSYTDWISTHQKGQILGCDGIGSPWITRFDFSFASTMYSTDYLIIDESHRAGIQDIYIPCSGHLIQTVSLSKAFGLPAGVILGSAADIEEIKKDSFWVGSSPPNLAFCHAGLHSIEAYKEQSRKSQALADRFAANLQESETAVTYEAGYPAFCSKASGLFEHLKSAGILVNHFAYPDITAPPVCRAILPACLTLKDIDTITDAIKNYA
jgi:7-keto-8-aminopelargonate synthetase-like enzyme